MPSTILSDNGVSSGSAGIKTTGSNDGALALQTTTAGGTATTAVTIDTSQNVGVGTSSPVAGARLAVVGGGIQLSGGTTSQEGVRVQRISGAATITGINNDNNAYNDIALYTQASEGARLTTGNNFQFNSGYGSVATAYGCRAWVNFNGTGTVAIRASGNVSSITDNGTGDYTVNFTTAMPDANYSVVAMNSAQTYTSLKTSTTPTTTAANLIIGGASDSSYMYAAIFR